MTSFVVRQWIEDDARFLDNIIFSDGSTFHVTSKVNTHNSMIWGTENLHASVEHVRDSCKVNVFCALCKDRVYSPFFFMRTTITSAMYLEILEHFLFPLFGKDDHKGRMNFQQDGAPPHYYTDVRKCLNTRFTGLWIGQAVPIPWPPRSTDLPLLGSFLWRFVKDRVYVPPLPANGAELQIRITTTVAEVTPDMLCCM
ncbi:hypothetical protein Cfor_10589 [Coptotermes formosanus]|jgi:hypothetical protein|uniref:Tc1-like transposase DDE domain-containing protein n=1 Tax=Coptotermes formosanus TaxID=36987 RepID=A0A6L2Q5Z8_COPFO|nr:hypothetical protein Cfor_10589 [Coptotermes formosanus]